MKRFLFLMTRFFLTGILAGWSSLSLNGQAFNEIRKIWLNDKSGIVEFNQKNKLLSRDDFYRYARMRDEQFTEYLKEPWTDFSIFDGLQEEPRFIFNKMSCFNYPDTDLTPPGYLPFSEVVETGAPGTDQRVWLPGINKPESEVFTSLRSGFIFYGQQITIRYDKFLLVSKTTTVSEDSVAGFWDTFSRSNSIHLVNQLMDYRDLLGLGDWGYFQLVKAASVNIFKANRWSSDLLTWALMIRSGFDVRLAYNQNSSSVLFPSINKIYSRQFVVIGAKRFYLDREMKSQLLVTCPNPFPDTPGLIDLKFYRSLNFRGELKVQKLGLLWNNNNFAFTLKFNPAAVRFYNDYPKTDPVIYFEAPFSATLKEEFLKQFHPILSKMGRPEAVAFLQKFVQQQFDYPPSDFRGEKFQGRFGEQLVASLSGDSRGKAVLFSKLVRTLIQIPVIGVHFPGYYSTAISFDEPLGGNYYRLNRRNFIIADPTINKAAIGAVIPDFMGLTPQIIDLSIADLQQNRAREIWKQGLKLGAMKVGTNQTAIFDRQGRALISGYLTTKNSYSPFIACFSEGNALQWIRKFDGSGEAMAYSITKVNDDEIYIAGSFRGHIGMDGITLQSRSGYTDLFFSRFSQLGKLIWMKSITIDTVAKDVTPGYLVKFDRSGDNLSLQLTNEDGRNIKTGFGYAGGSGLYFTGSQSSTPGLVPGSWKMARHNISGEVLKEYGFLLGKKCDSKVAGILAVLKLLQKAGAEVSGRQLQNLITLKNPLFQKNQPSLFNAIGQIERLKNDNGIVSVQIIGNRSVTFNNLGVDDEAGLNLSGFDNGDFSVGVISGLHEIIDTVRLPVNSVIVDFSDGGLTIDYDYDHTMKTISF